MDRCCYILGPRFKDKESSSCEHTASRFINTRDQKIRLKCDIIMGMRKFYVLVITLLLVSPIFRLHAQEVDILWQGKTYTPPFYKGKTLWSSQSKIALLAIPHISGAGNPVNLTYKWIKNGTVLGNINGVGKNTLAFTDSILSKPQTIKVEILSEQKTVLASASIFVTPTPS